MPENAINICRPGKWGNPFRVDEYGLKLSIANHKALIEALQRIGALDLKPLRGKDLVCWCKEGAPCHGDFLIYEANKNEIPQPI